jgi:hypothetical protein
MEDIFLGMLFAVALMLSLLVFVLIALQAGGYLPSGSNEKKIVRHTLVIDYLDEFGQIVNGRERWVRDIKTWSIDGSILTLNLVGDVTEYVKISDNQTYTIGVEDDDYEGDGL